MNKIIFPLRLWQFMRYAVKEVSPKEIQGFGRINDNGEVTELFITKQSVSSGFADTEDEVIHKLLYHLATKNQEKELKLWWHSHGTMEPFLSTTDVNTLDKITGDFMIALVTNTEGQTIVEKITKHNKKIDRTPISLAIRPTQPITKEELIKLKKSLDQLVYSRYYGYYNYSYDNYKKHKSDKWWRWK